MSRINDIQTRILQLEGGRYQKLLDCYLYRKYGYDNWSPLGSQLGTDKTVKGTPDTYIRTTAGKYIFLMYGTVQGDSFNKIKRDIESCLNQKKTGIDESDIEQIICCHTSARLTAGENKTLHELFNNVRLIGIGELSLDLCYQYQVLAKEYLNLSIDTNQILEDKDFVEKSESSAFTTPLSNKLLCRENEKSEVLNLLAYSDVVIISGKSGGGKTRLALEVGREFSKINCYIFRCIKQNGEPIYEDLKTHFVDESDYCVLIDDANMLVHLGHLLDICNDKNKKYNMKLIITVRDYAKDDVLQRVKKQLMPEIYDLNPLSDSNLKEVLKQEFGILNQEYLECVAKVSSGNMRLAIMATISLRDGKLENLHNIIDIYDFYYQDIIDKMGRTLIITGAIIALFDSLKLNKQSNIAIELAQKNNISQDEFKEACYELHKLEVVDIHKDLAVKCSGQALSNYLLFLVFYKDKVISISDVINLCFPRYKTRLSYAFNTLMNLFYSEELEKYAFSEMKKSWLYFKNRELDIQRQFLSTFYVAVKVETLYFLNNQIKLLPEIQVDFLTYDFESKSNNENIQSDILKMIANFKYTAYFFDAIDLLLFHLEKNTQNPMDFYFLLKSYFIVDKESHHYNYKFERDMLNLLVENYHRSHNTNVAILLIYYCQWTLKFEFQSIEATSYKSFSHTIFGLMDCDEIRKLRDHAIEILFELYDEESGKYRTKVMKALKTYMILLNFDTSSMLAEKDAIKMDECVSRYFCMDEINECLTVEYLHDEVVREFPSYANLLNQYKSNSLYLKYREIKRDRLRWLSSDNYEDEYSAKIAEIAKYISEEELYNLMQLMKSDLFSDQWETGEALSMLLCGLQDNEVFSKVLLYYFELNMSYILPPANVCKKLIQIKGYQKAWQFVESTSYNHKNNWLISLAWQIDDSDINKKYADEILHIVKSSIADEKFSIPHLDFVIRINNKCFGFAVEYLKLLIESYAEKPLFLADFLSITSIPIEDILDNFDYPNNTLLEEAYIVSYSAKNYFDYEQKMLIEVIKRNKLFLRKFVLYQLESHIVHDGLCALWSLENCNDLITEIIDIIKEHKWGYYGYFKIVESIFSIKKGKQYMDKQDLWIQTYIKNNYNSPESIKFIFNSICHLPDDRRLKMILLFCKYNSAYNAFQNIRLFPMHYAITGSMVSHIEKQISFVKRLKEGLEGRDYIEHKMKFEEILESLENQKEKELIDEFMEID